MNCSDGATRAGKTPGFESSKSTDFKTAPPGAVGSSKGWRGIAEPMRRYWLGRGNAEGGRNSKRAGEVVEAFGPEPPSSYPRAQPLKRTYLPQPKLPSRRAPAGAFVWSEEGRPERGDVARIPRRNHEPGPASASNQREGRRGWKPQEGRRRSESSDARVRTERDSEGRAVSTKTRVRIGPV